MATKTELIIFFVFFYALVGVLAGYLNAYFSQDINIDTENSNKVSGFFLDNVVNGFSELGTTFNVVFFGSLITIIAWIILSSLPTVNGGG